MRNVSQSSWSFFSSPSPGYWSHLKRSLFSLDFFYLKYFRYTTHKWVVLLKCCSFWTLLHWWGIKQLERYAQFIAKHFFMKGFFIRPRPSFVRTLCYRTTSVFDRNSNKPYVRKELSRSFLRWRQWQRWLLFIIRLRNKNLS